MRPVAAHRAWALGYASGVSVVFNSLNNVLGLMSCKRSSENGQVLVGFVLEDAYIGVYGDFDPGSGCPHLIEKDGHRGQVVVAVRNTLTAHQQAFAEFHGGLTGPRRDPHSGHLFVFRSRRGGLIKVLWHDGQGMCLYAKRLERGRRQMAW